MAIKTLLKSKAFIIIKVSPTTHSYGNRSYFVPCIKIESAVVQIKR